MRRRNGNILSFILKPLLIALLIFCVFSLVYLRSSFLTLEYSLGDLEKKKMNCLRERKMLLAEKASLLSAVSYSESSGFIWPDRVKVMHVDRQKGYLPHKASLERKQLTEP